MALKIFIKICLVIDIDLLSEVLYSNVPKLDCRCIFGRKVHVLVL